MALPPATELRFEKGCPDCARREVVNLPGPLPEIGNDVDWNVRDYDGFRLAMMEELAARFPERTRWNPADVEVVLVETFAAVLDQLSDMLDRVTAEGYLETARRPESVRRLLEFIGYDPLAQAFADGTIQTSPDADRAAAAHELARAWAERPWLMDDARRAGPRDVHQQKRMASLDDHAALLEAHPLIRRANATEIWNGSWTVIRAAVVCWSDRRLDDTEASPDVPVLPAQLRDALSSFERRHKLSVTAWTGSTSFRTVLTRYVEHLRMVGREVVLTDAVPVGIVLAAAVQVGPAYYQSEVRREIERVLGRGPDGFFEPGRLRFGEDVRASDLIQAITAVDGVQTVALTRFKRAGAQYTTSSERIILEGDELAVCDNDPQHGERGYFTLRLMGGRRG